MFIKLSVVLLLLTFIQSIDMYRPVPCNNIYNPICAKMLPNNESDYIQFQNDCELNKARGRIESIRRGPCNCIGSSKYVKGAGCIRQTCTKEYKPVCGQYNEGNNIYYKQFNSECMISSYNCDYKTNYGFIAHGTCIC